MALGRRLTLDIEHMMASLARCEHIGGVTEETRYICSGCCNLDLLWDRTSVIDRNFSSENRNGWTAVLKE